MEMLQEKNSELKQLHEYLEALRKYEQVAKGTGLSIDKIIEIKKSIL